MKVKGFRGGRILVMLVEASKRYEGYLFLKWNYITFFTMIPLIHTKVLRW